MRCEITDENTLAVALAEPKLASVSEDALKNCLRYVYTLVGLRAPNFPVDPEKQLLHHHIRKHFGKHTAAEVRLAFEMAINGRLDIDPKEVKCYQDFTPAYFSAIMVAFRKWAAIEARRLETRNPRPSETTPAQQLDINIGYAYYLHKLINKLPATYERLKR